MKLTVVTITLNAVSFITDDAPSMTGEKEGFVNLFTKEVGHTVIGFYCIMHKEAICAWPEGSSGSDAISYQNCELHFCSDIT